MTKLQIEEFSKLELAYLESVSAQQPDEQLRHMELIFYWLKKQQHDEEVKVSIVVNVNKDLPAAREITTDQKGEFTFLQMQMIHAATRVDRPRMVEVEIKMRQWIDKQITASVSRLIRPKMKVIVKPDQPGRNGKN
jgi:hypothetical protein